MAIEENEASVDGGGLYASTSSEVGLYTTSLTGNTAAESGGGVYLREAALEMIGGGLYENEAASGGGINTVNAYLSIEDATITGNTASELGGGLTMDARTEAVVDYTLFTENSPWDMSKGETIYDYGGYASFYCEPESEMCGPLGGPP